MIAKRLLISKLLFSGLSIVSVSAIAQQAFMAPLVGDSLLLDVELRGKQAVAVGERGHIVKFDASDKQVLSTNKSKVEQVSVPTTTTLTAITSSDDSYWVVGHDASILQSVNNGESWSLVFSDADLDRPFLDVIFLSRNEGIAVGAYGTFYRTIDEGITWEPELHASVLSRDDIEYLDSIKNEPEFYNEELSYILPHFNRIRQYNEQLMLAGEAGLLALSNDSGRSWQRIAIDYQGSFFDFAQINETVQLAVGLRGNMFTRVGDGSWQSLNTCVSTSLNSIVIANNGAYVLGNNGVVLFLDVSKAFDSGAPYTAGRDSSSSNNTSHDPRGNNCVIHPSLARISTDISSSIANGIISDGVLNVVSESGIKTIVVTN